MIPLGEKLPWTPFGIVEEVMKPLGVERAKVVDTQIGARNHILFRRE